MKKIFQILTLCALSCFLFAVSISASEYIPAFGEMTFIDGMAEDSVFGDDGRADTCTSRVLMSDGKTYPTYYILNNNETLQVNFSELNNKTADTRPEGFSYDRSTVICLEICEGVTTLPNCFSASGSAIFWGDKYTSTIEYLKTPSTLTSLSTDATIYSMKSLKCVDFSLSQFEEIPSRGLQSASALEEIYFPITLKALGANCMSGCSSLKEVDFSYTQLEVVGYRALFDCHKLEVVNLGAHLKKMETQCFYKAGTKSDKTVVVYKISSTLEEIYNQFGKIWQDAKAPLIYYTGSLDDAGMTVLKTDGGAGSWPTIDISSDDYDENAEYTKATIIYGCNSCITFFGSHSEGAVLNSCQFGCGRGCGLVELLPDPKHELVTSADFGENGYFSSSIVTVTCSVCSTATAQEALDSMFVSLGISAKSFGDDAGLVQGYQLNKDAIATYKTYFSDFNFGVLACANSSNEEIAPNPSDDGVINISFDNMANDYIDVKIMGISVEHASTPIVFCIYVLDGGKIFYLENGATKEAVKGSSYSENI